MKKCLTRSIAAAMLIPATSAMLVHALPTHAASVGHQPTAIAATNQANLKTVFEQASKAVQGQSINTLKAKYHLQATKYVEQASYLDHVSDFYHSYNPQLGVQRFMEEILARQLVDKAFNLSHANDISHVWSAYFLYDAGFDRNGKLFQMIGPSPQPEPNLPKRQIQVTEQATGKLINLNAFYLDQGSDTTIVATGGFRGNGWDITSPEVQILKSFGYNVLMTEPRSSGTSQGTYISLGYYEKDDFAAWVHDEINLKPTQKILLYGGSMGAAVAMGALNNNLPQNVKGLVEISGYAAIDQQMTDVYNALSKTMGPTVADLLGFTAAQRAATFNLLEQQLLLPNVKMPFKSDLPLQGVQSTTLPKLFIHGDADKIVPEQNAQLLFDKASGTENRLEIVHGATHGGDIFVGDMGKQTQNAMQTFFESTIKNTAK